MAFRGNGGSNMANGMASSDIINFIDNQQFLELVLGKQSYDSTEEEKCSVNDLLQITNNIFAEAIPPVKKDGDTRKVGMGVSESIVPSNISHLIKWIGCQMTCEVMHGKDLEERLLAIFLKLSSYRRTTQVALVLAALALQYGEFWYISEAPFALSTGVLKGLSALKKKLISDENKKAAITPFNKVVNDLLELTTRLLDLYKLVNERDRKPVPELVKTGRTIPRWSCETIITILATGNFFARLTDVNYKYYRGFLVYLSDTA
ncbi:protein SIEVE ELEMENT OCCLUSION B-like [Eucalyptus grandis]|uniref:protein SIEVE ELEMENT OCCLUSION B-like n=1 Tax=Eucalyptus grandis TaxID=71139 RepID=UPI0005244DBE|nr:protein SIEVE ELEMENT OCCLUSION B-like [Eucalyptus grandis]